MGKFGFILIVIVMLSTTLMLNSGRSILKSNDTNIELDINEDTTNDNELLNVTIKGELDDSTCKISFIIINVTFFINRTGFYYVSTRLNQLSGYFTSHDLFYPEKTGRYIHEPGVYTFSNYYWSPKLWSELISENITLEELLVYEIYLCNGQGNILYEWTGNYRFPHINSNELLPSPLIFNNRISKTKIDTDNDGEYDSMRLRVYYNCTIESTYELSFKLKDSSNLYRWYSYKTNFTIGSNHFEFEIPYSELQIYNGHCILSGYAWAKIYPKPDFKAFFDQSSSYGIRIATLSQYPLENTQTELNFNISDFSPLSIEPVRLIDSEIKWIDYFNNEQKSVIDIDVLLALPEDYKLRFYLTDLNRSYKNVNLMGFEKDQLTGFKSFKGAIVVSNLERYLQVKEYVSNVSLNIEIPPHPDSYKKPEFNLSLGEIEYINNSKGLTENITIPIKCISNVNINFSIDYYLTGSNNDRITYYLDDSNQFVEIEKGENWFKYTIPTYKFYYCVYGVVSSMGLNHHRSFYYDWLSTLKSLKLRLDIEISNASFYSNFRPVYSFARGLDFEEIINEAMINLPNVTIPLSIPELSFENEEVKYKMEDELGNIKYYILNYPTFNKVKSTLIEPNTNTSESEYYLIYPQEQTLYYSRSYSLNDMYYYFSGYQSLLLYSFGTNLTVGNMYSFSEAYLYAKDKTVIEIENRLYKVVILTTGTKKWYCEEQTGIILGYQDSITKYTLISSTLLRFIPDFPKQKGFLSPFSLLFPILAIVVINFRKRIL